MKKCKWFAMILAAAMVVCLLGTSLSVSAEETAASKGKVAYRTPLVVVARIVDGQTVLGQTRIPVYQFGKLLYFPLDLALGK